MKATENSLKYKRKIVIQEKTVKTARAGCFLLQIFQLRLQIYRCVKLLRRYAELVFERAEKVCIIRETAFCKHFGYREAFFDKLF